MKPFKKFSLYQESETETSHSTNYITMEKLKDLKIQDPEKNNGWSFDYGLCKNIANESNESDPDVEPLSMEQVDYMLRLIYPLIQSLQAQLEREKGLKEGSALQIISLNAENKELKKGFRKIFTIIDSCDDGDLINPRWLGEKINRFKKYLT